MAQVNETSGRTTGKTTWGGGAYSVASFQTRLNLAVLAAAVIVAVSLIFGAVSSAESAFAADDAVKFSNDVVLVVPDDSGSTPAAPRVRGAFPGTGDGLPWLPVALVALAAGGAAVAARTRMAKAQAHAGAHGKHAKPRGDWRGLFVTFAAAVLVGAGGYAALLPLQADADDASAVRINLERADDGTLSGQATFKLSSGADADAALNALSVTVYEGYSLTDGSIELSIAPESAQDKVVTAKDAAEPVDPGAKTGAADAWTVHGKSAGDSEGLTLVVTVKASGLNSGTHTIARIDSGIEPPATTAAYTVRHLGQNVAGTAYDEVLAESKTLGTIGQKTAAESRQFEGFIAVTPVEQKEIAADGSTVVDVLYDRVKVTVSFDAGGRGGVPDDQVLNIGATATAPALEATGYTLVGWMTERDGSEAWDFSTPVTEDMTLYAKWERNSYAIVFDANGGAGSMDPIRGVHYDANTTLTKNTFTNAGYTFNGWNTAADGSGQGFGDEQQVAGLSMEHNATVTLYAQWSPKTDTPYQVVHKKQSAPGSDEYAAVEGDTQNLTGTTGADTQAAAKSYNGFTAQDVVQKKIAGDGSTVVEVLYDWNIYTVTFEMWGIGDDEDNKKVKVAHGNEVKLTDAPKQAADPDTADMPRFVGWYSDSDLINEFTFPARVTQDITIYAKYFPNVLVKFQTDGVEDVSVPGEINKEFPVSKLDSIKNNPPAGYTVEGFFTDSSYENAFTGFASLGDNEVVYARLTPNTNTSYTVKHLQQLLDDATAYVEVTEDTETLTGTTGADTQAAAKSYDGFTALTVTQQKIAGDGSTVIEIKYDRNTNTNYTVKHLQQDLVGDGYTEVAADEERKTGKTGALTEAAAKTYDGFTAQSITQVAIDGSGNTVVEVKYDRTVYPVTFTTQFGTAPDTQYVRYGGTATKPDDLSQPGCKFVGWYDDAVSTTTMFDFTTVITQATQITAHWDETLYEVKFSVVEKVARAMDDYVQKIGYGGHATRPQIDPSKPGYKLVDWFKRCIEGVYSEVYDFENEAVTEDITLYGEVVGEDFTVVFDANGGTGSMEALSGTWGDAFDLTENAFTRTGYVFTGWNTVSNGKNGQAFDDKAELKTGVDGDITWDDSGKITLYAQWEPVKYTIKFDGNGATSGSMADMTVSYDTTENLPKNDFTKTKNGVELDIKGWSRNADGSGVLIPKEGPAGGLSNVNGDEVTLYAVWEDPTIIFDPNLENNGQGVSYSQYVEDFSSVKLVELNEEKIKASAGYQEKLAIVGQEIGSTPNGFVGWNTAPDGSGVWLLDGEDDAEWYVTSSRSKPITLYAQWSYLGGVPASELAKAAKALQGQNVSLVGQRWSSAADGESGRLQTSSLPKFREGENGTVDASFFADGTTNAWENAYAHEVDNYLICYVIGTDVDELASGGKATLTLMTSRAMPASACMRLEDGSSGHSGLGFGWQDSFMREHLNKGGIVYSIMPTSIQNAVKPVKKACQMDDAGTLGYTEDEFWLLSRSEATNTAHTSGIKEGDQYAFFSGANGAMKATSAQITNLGWTNSLEWYREVTKFYPYTNNYLKNSRGHQGTTFPNTDRAPGWKVNLWSRTPATIKQHNSNGDEYLGVKLQVGNGLFEAGGGGQYSSFGVAPCFCLTDSES